jgi:mRNA interferase RelE/StbE
MSESDGYRLDFTEAAREDLRKLDKKISERIFKKLLWLADNAVSIKHEALTGQWIGYYRWRIGDYRAIYELDTEGKIVIVAVIGHRRDVYNDH